MTQTVPDISPLMPMHQDPLLVLLAVDKENNNDPLNIWGLYLFVLAFPGECVNQLGSEVKSIPERSAGWFKTLDVWHRLMLCDIKKIFFIDMKFGINQAISQTITQLSCIQLETPSSRLRNFWWIKTYTTFKINKWWKSPHWRYTDPVMSHAYHLAQGTDRLQYK